MKKPLEFLFPWHVTHTELLAAGQSSLIINRPFNNRIPPKLYIFMVKQTADWGSYVEDPFFYQTNGLQNYHLMLDSKVLINQDISIEKDAIPAYLNSLQAQNNSEKFHSFRCLHPG